MTLKHKTDAYRCLGKFVSSDLLDARGELDVQAFAKKVGTTKQACYNQFNRNLISPKWLRRISAQTTMPMNELMNFIK